MDDLKFRRSIYADPNSDDAELLAAIKADANRQQLAKDIAQFDKKIASALSVALPEDLASKLIFRQTMASHQQQKRRGRIQLAVAASVAFAIGLSVNFMPSSAAYNSIGDYALAHTHHEEHMPHYFSHNEVTLAALNDKMAAFSGSFQQNIGKLISLGVCDFGGIQALHLVYQGEHSPITVFVTKDDSAFKNDGDFADKSLHGTTLHYKNVDVIIVSGKDEALQPWQSNLQHNIRWST